MKLNVKSLSEVELGFPVFQKGIYHAKIGKCEVKPNKRGDGNNLIVKATLLDPVLVLHKDGKEITNKGNFTLTRYVSLTPTEDYDPDKNVKEMAVAVKHDQTTDFNLEDLEDKIVMVALEVQDERVDKGTTYPQSNTIRRFTPLPAEDNFTPPPF